MTTGLRRVGPGFVLLCLGALTAHVLSTFIGINELLLAIGIGIILTNTVGIPERFQHGTETYRIWLAAGIVLLGSSLTAGMLVETGGTVLVLLVATVTITLITVELIARNVAGVGHRLGSLLAAGAGVCGVSAVAAVGQAVRAREVHIAYAAGVVLLVDAVTIVVYPIIGSLLDLPDVVFGVWAGVSMLSTGPTVAVGFAHSELAGQWATTTKLARNALIGVVVLGYASYYARRGESGSPSARMLWESVPKFIFGFIILAVLASVGAFSPEQQESLANAVNWLFLLAFVGLGTEIGAENIRKTGVAPVLTVLTAFVVVSALSLMAALAVL